MFESRHEYFSSLLHINNYFTIVEKTNQSDFTSDVTGELT